MNKQILNNDVRNLTKWLNEEQEAPIDRQALARVLAMAEKPEPVTQWYLSKDGLPPVGSEVIGGHFYKDTWLKGNPEVFGWGRCRVILDDHPDFPDGKMWLTFGPSHNQITHWCWPPKKPQSETTEQIGARLAQEGKGLSDIYGAVASDADMSEAQRGYESALRNQGENK